MASDINRARRHERTCAGKKRFDSRETASAGLRQLVADQPAADGLLEVYRCCACGTWHFGHRMKIKPK